MKFSISINFYDGERRIESKSFTKGLQLYKLYLKRFSN